MKYILLVLACFISIASCDIRKTKNQPDVQHSSHSGEKTVNKDSTSVQVIDSVYNFGQVVDGEKVEYNFRFKNSGIKPLIVQNVSASCGCTVPQKPEEPIAPGQIGFIKVIFDSKGRVGSTNKDVTVVSNAYPEFPVMRLTGEVVEKK